MKLSAIRLLCLLGLAGMSASVAASEQRVLLSFDNAGHHVRQIVYPETQPLLRPSPSEPTARRRGPVDVPALASTLRPGTALLIWMDDNGFSQANTEVPDPRILHAPAHIDGSAESIVNQLSGAWLVEGPSSATSLTILLPSHLSLGLGFEQWDVVLAL